MLVLVLGYALRVLGIYCLIKWQCSLKKWYLPFVFLFLFTGSSRPQFVGDLKNITVAIGREATFSCNVRNLVPFKVSSMKNGILLPKLFWPTVREKCSSDRENLLKFEAEGREFAKILRSLEQFVWTNKLEQFKLEKNIGI